MHQQNYFALSWKFNKITFHSVFSVQCMHNTTQSHIQIRTHANRHTSMLDFSIFTIDRVSVACPDLTVCMLLIVYLYIFMDAYILVIRFRYIYSDALYAWCSPILFTQTSRVNLNTAWIIEYKCANIICVWHVRAHIHTERERERDGRRAFIWRSRKKR